MLSLTPLRRVRLLLGLGSGLILTFGFAPYHTPLVAWLAMAMLVFAALDARPRIAFLCGFLHGAVYSGISVAWIYGVQRQHGGLLPFAAAALLALMVASWGVFPGAFAAAVAWMSRRSIGWGCAAAPFLWVTVEFARHHLPEIGFPWNLLGYAVSDNLGLVQLTTITGIYGLSFVVAAYGALCAWLLVVQTRRAFGAWLAVTVVLLPLAVVGGRFVPQDAPTLKARLVQTNLPQGRYPADWQQQYAAAFDELERLSIAGTAPAGAQAGAAAQGAASVVPAKPVALIVWPEVPAPFYLQDARFAARAQRIAQGAQAPFLLGVVEWRASGGAAPAAMRFEPYNSAVLLGPAGERQFTYDKIHLVPFGEYVPWRNVLRFAEKLTTEVGDFSRGRERKVGPLPGGRFAVVVCYEAIFGNEVRRFVADGAELLVNISNDGWFGRSAAPDQHLAMARVRAVENRRWLLRATNNGHTVAVDPYGRIVARMPTDIRSAMEVPFAFRSDRTIYSRFGDWLAWVSVAVSGLALLWSRKSSAARK
jgi:apolipoprotein N-acyltransferase